MVQSRRHSADMSPAAYSFLPFLRQGLANSLQNTGGARAVYTVNLAIEADGATADTVPPRSVELYGPGDILGIDPRAVLRTDPLPYISNFEPNYLACIDFYDEDFPWRYTPLTPVSERRLAAWLALVVLKTDEFDEGMNLVNRPLPYFTLRGVTAAELFPKPDQLWAWSHVHVNSDVVGATVKSGAAQMAGVLDSLQSRITADPDSAYSRIICPRKLEENTTYNAFLVPAFESGRRAGLGEPAAAIAAAGSQIAWAGAAAPVLFPIYYRWQFSTGTVGDFEYLVRILAPMPVDLRVGRRDMDMTLPGANLAWEEHPDFDLNGILRLGGALQPPRDTLPDDEKARLDALDGWGRDRLPHPFQRQIATLLNLADEYAYKPAADANADAAADGLPIPPETEAGEDGGGGGAGGEGPVVPTDADPLITPPIYGRWHAMVERVLEDRAGTPIHNDYNWITELNLDPRYRVPAHFGTRVVQENQEEYMNAAWEQIGDVLKANEKIRYAVFAQASANAWYAKHVTPMAAQNPEKCILLSAPAQRRVLLDGLTVHQVVRESVLPAAVVSAPMRRIARTNGPLAKRLQKHLPDRSFRPERVVGKLSRGEIRVSPPKRIAPALPSAEQVADALTPASLPGWLAEWLRKWSWLPYAVLASAAVLILILLFFGPIGWVLAALVAAGALWLYRLLRRWQQSLAAIDAIKSGAQTPATVDALPSSSDFGLEPIDSTVAPQIGGTVDSAAAVRFKQGLRDAFELVTATRAAIPDPPPFKPLDVTQVATSIATSLNPAVTIPRWTWAHVSIPGWIRAQMEPEVFTEAMAYPRIDYPMYEPLAKISAELFLPNVNLIEYNSITLLETNQEFIEAYMVGLNHEFARELLWREYPTDQRGSTFRQFWDVSTLLASDVKSHAGKTEEEIREMYRDIPKLHRWSRTDKLGEHDHRQAPGEPESEEVVLAIRGELLKKYPNAVVYAHKAVWAPKSNSDATFDKSKSRLLYKPEEGDKSEPAFAVIRTPLYRAQIEPDITFFGFKLGVKEAKGEGDPATPTLANAGWFFVIKERPGEPRFGFDIPKSDVDAAPNLTWNDISWTEVLPGLGVIDAVSPAQTITLAASVPAGTPGANEQGFLAQRAEDLQIRWNGSGHAVDAADLAYILYQVPVLVAVHAAEMIHKT